MNEVRIDDLAVPDRGPEEQAIYDLALRMRVDLDPEDAQLRDQVLFGIRERRHRVELAGLLHGRDAEGVLGRSAQHHEFHGLRRFALAEVVGDGREVVGRGAVHRHEDVAGLKTGSFGRSARPYVGHDQPRLA